MAPHAERDTIFTNQLPAFVELGNIRAQGIVSESGKLLTYSLRARDFARGKLSQS